MFGVPSAWWTQEGLLTKASVPISKLPALVTQTRDDMDASGIIGTMVGHVGDGTFTPYNHI
jgi:D-lactate dehydrogenase (cytochrome)